MTHNLKPAEKQAFSVTLRRLAERHGLLPDRMKITEELKVSDEELGSGGFGDIVLGTYKGCAVAVKTMKVTLQDDFLIIRKVSNSVSCPG